MTEFIERNIPPRFRDATFATYEPRTAQQRRAFEAVHAWLAIISTGPMLALVGKQGTGKSHLLYAAAAALLTQHSNGERNGPIPFIAPWYRLADELRYGRNGSRHKAADEVRADFWSSKVVIIDEVRPTAETAFDDTELSKFASYAFDFKVAVLLTTNIQPLSDVIGEAAASRFSQVIVDGPDARQASHMKFMVK